MSLCQEKAFFNLAHEEVGKSWCYWGAHGNTGHLLVQRMVKRKVVLFEDERFVVFHRMAMPSSCGIDGYMELMSIVTKIIYLEHQSERV